MHTHTHLYTDTSYTSVCTHSYPLIYSINIPHHHNICIHPYVNIHIYPYDMYLNYICVPIYTRFHIHINTQHSHHTQTCIFSPFLHTYIHIKYTHSHILYPHAHSHTCMYNMYHILHAHICIYLYLFIIHAYTYTHISQLHVCDTCILISTCVYRD